MEARTGHSGGGRVPCRRRRGRPAVRPRRRPARRCATSSRAALDRVLDDGRYILGPEVEAFEREFAAWLGTRARRRRRQRHRGDHDRAAGARRRARRRGRRAVVHVLRERRGDPADRRHARVLRRRPRDVPRDARDGARGPHAAHEGGRSLVHLFGNVAPVAEVEALGVPVLEDAAQATGSRAGRRRCTGALGTIATFSFYPSKNLGGLGDGGAVVDRRRRARRARAHAALPRLAGQGDVRRRSATTAASTSCRPPRCASSCRTCTRGATRRRAAGRAYADAGLGDHVRLPVPAAGADPAWNLYVVRHPRPEELAAALRGQGHRRAHVLLASPRTASRRSPPRARRRPARDRGGRADASRAADGRRAHARSRWARSWPPSASAEL